MNSKLYGSLIFELSHEGRKGYSLPKNNFGDYEIPASMKRAEDAQLPECDELTVVRHCSAPVPKPTSKTTGCHREGRVGFGDIVGEITL